LLCRPPAPRRALARRSSCKGERLAVVRLALLAEGILPGLGWLPGQRERRERGATFLLLVPLCLRLLLFLVAAHLTLGHDVPPVSACPPCAGGGGIEAPRAHGFKRSLAGVDSALRAHPLRCAEGGIARPPAAPLIGYILNMPIDYVK